MRFSQQRQVARRHLMALVAGAAIISVIAACSSSKSGSATGGASGSSQPSNGRTIKVGVLTSLTGPAASGFTGIETGVKSRFELANASGGINGHKIEYVMADDASTAQGTLAAANKMIQQDKVDAIVEVSSTFFGGYKPVVQAGIPTFGTSFDGGPEWADKANTSLFPIGGVGNYHLVATTFGTIAKKFGVTKMGGISYTVSQSSTLAAKEWIASAKAAGLQEGYSQGVAFGSTDVGPFILGVKNSNTDGFYAPTISNTAFAVAEGLTQQGVKMKGVFLANGYGATLLNTPAAVQAAQGLQFLSPWSPVELKTPATIKLQDALSKYGNVSADLPPDSLMVQAYQAADALVWAFTNAKDDISKENVVKVNRNGTWDGAGLMEPLDFSKYDGLAGGGLGPNNCVYVLTLKGKTFVPEKDLSPACGTIINGLTV
jgi:branched-chain amino acid transport system substrate-binding protein